MNPRNITPHERTNRDHPGEQLRVLLALGRKDQPAEWWHHRKHQKHLHQGREDISTNHITSKAQQLTSRSRENYRPRSLKLLGDAVGFVGCRLSVLQVRVTAAGGTGYGGFYCSASSTAGVSARPARAGQERTTVKRSSNLQSGLPLRLGDFGRWASGVERSVEGYVYKTRLDPGRDARHGIAVNSRRIDSALTGITFGLED